MKANTQSAEQLCQRIGREVDGSVEDFAAAVVEMAGVIELMLHAASAASEASDINEARAIDWTPIVGVLKASRSRFPAVYGALACLRDAGRGGAR
jgi:hypothetical protein